MTERQFLLGLSNGAMVLAIAGSAVSLVVFSTAVGVEKQMFLGGTMGALLWFSAAYILWRADRISARAVREQWRV